MWRRNAVAASALAILGLLVCVARAQSPAGARAAVEAPVVERAAAERADAMLDAAVRALRDLPPEQQQSAIARAEKRFRATAASGRPWLLRIFNMTSWIELPWFLLGVGGQLAFFLRMFVQWVASERKRRSVVPTAFWWLSLGGSVLLVTYAVWRKDIVIVFGQLLGIGIYARNLWFIHKATGRDEAPEDAGAADPVDGSEATPPEVVVGAREMVGAQGDRSSRHAPGSSPR